MVRDGTRRRDTGTRIASPAVVNSFVPLAVAKGGETEENLVFRRGSAAELNEVRERANPGRPGDAKPTGLSEAAGLPNHLQEVKSRFNYTSGGVEQMKFDKWTIGLIGVGLVFGAVSGLGQVTEGSTAVFSVGTLIRLTLTTNTIDFGTLTMADYDTGYKDKAGAQGIAIWSNKAWTLTIKADVATWSGPWAKPSTDLRWKVGTWDAKVTERVTSYTGLTTSATQVAAGTKGGNIGLTMDFRVLVSWENDPAGDYSLAFTYTLTAP